MKNIIFFVYRFFYLFLAVILVVSAFLANTFVENMFLYGLVLLLPTLIVATILFVCIVFINERKQNILRTQIKYLEGTTAFLWAVSFITFVMLGAAALVSDFLP